MPDQLCRCCAWTNIVPDQAGEAFVSCPECGQMLMAPSPWFSRNIPNCDTRPMIAYPEEMADPSAALVPWKLTCQVGQVSQHTPGHMIRSGLGGIGMGALLLATRLGNFWEDREIVRWFVPLVGLLMVLGGAVVLHTGLRKTRRRTRARVVRLDESLPAQAYKLGAPVALHQVRMYWRSVYVCAGILLCLIASVCVGMILANQIPEHRIAEIAVLGWPVGLYMIWQGMKRQGKRILVFADGLVTFERGRAVVCRWDCIESVWIAPMTKAGDVNQSFILTLRRPDGEEMVFTSDTEYIENQFVARAQYEHCARMLPSLQAKLGDGRTLDFGPLQVSGDGMRRDGNSFSWNEIHGAFLDGAKVKVVGDSRTWELKAATVPNLAILLALIQHRSRGGYQDDLRTSTASQQM